MKKIYFFVKILIIYLFLISTAFAVKSDYFNEKSYLYLAKIFNKNNNDQEEEMKLNNVLLLNPKNDEAIYMLILLKIKKSDYNEAKVLIEKFNLVCNLFCLKKSEIQEKFGKLTP